MDDPIVLREEISKYLRSQIIEHPNVRKYKRMALKIKCINEVNPEFRCSRCGKSFEWFDLDFYRLNHKTHKVPLDENLIVTDLLETIKDSVLLCHNCNRIISSPKAVIGYNKRMRRKEFLIKELGMSCPMCGLTYLDTDSNLSPFDFHHLDPSKKEHTISCCLGWKEDEYQRIIVPEVLSNCSLVDANCHNLIHLHKEIKLDTK
jgi:hypothetical protein